MCFHGNFVRLSVCDVHWHFCMIDCTRPNQTGVVYLISKSNISIASRQTRVHKRLDRKPSNCDQFTWWSVIFGNLLHPPGHKTRSTSNSGIEKKFVDSFRCAFDEQFQIVLGRGRRIVGTHGTKLAMKRHLVSLTTTSPNIIVCIHLTDPPENKIAHPRIHTHTHIHTHTRIRTCNNIRHF